MSEGNSGKSLEDLEREKLEVEIKKLNRDGWISLLSAVAIIVTAILTWQSGIFDVRKEKLELDIAKFEDKKDSLQDSIKYLQDTLYKKQEKERILSDSIAIFQEERKTLSQQLSLLNDSINKIMWFTEEMRRADLDVQRYIMIRWPMHASQDSSAIYVLDERWNPMKVGVRVDSTSLGAVDRKGKVKFSTSGIGSGKVEVNIGDGRPNSDFEFTASIESSTNYLFIIKRRGR